MRFRSTAGTLFCAFALAACSDQSPTEVDLSAPAQAAAAHGHSQQAERAVQRAQLLTEIPISAMKDGVAVPAFLSLTELDAEATDDGVQLFADGVISYVTEDGQYLAETFEDVPISLTRAPTATETAFNAALLPAGSAAQQRGPSESGVCDILYLTLGPLNLDLLGLTVDLSNIELDIDAVPGAGRLLGNLLCAVTGLLDLPGAILQILQILGQINDLLDAINNLFSGIPAVGSVLSGDATGLLASSALTARKIESGEFDGTLTVTAVSWDETAQTLLVDGILNGKARVDGKMRQIRDVAIEGVPATLDDDPNSSIAASLAAAPGGMLMQRSPDEDAVCDILYLDLAPTFLDLLGLTVDLDQVELDVDAVPGSGRLLGNLLCAVTGLLDGVGSGGGLGGLLQGLLQGLLDAVNQLLGGLSL